MGLLRHCSENEAQQKVSDADDRKTVFVTGLFDRAVDNNNFLHLIIEEKVRPQFSCPGGRVVEIGGNLNIVGSQIFLGVEVDLVFLPYGFSFPILLNACETADVYGVTVV